jgi:hypothetical protein
LLLLAVGWFACLVSGCWLDTHGRPQTQMVMEVDADAQLRALSAHVKVMVVGGDVLNGAAPISNYQKTFSPGAPSQPSWPLRLIVEPHPKQTMRTFTLTATALDGNNGFLAEVRLRSGYVARQVHFVRLELSEPCIGIACDAEQTCSEGRCQDAFLAPNDTSRYPPPPNDVPLDASSPDAQVRDAGGDARADAGSAAASTQDDAGSEPRDRTTPSQETLPADPCANTNGGCDALVTCQNQNGLAICGRCPAGYEDAQRDGKHCSDVDECRENNGGCDALRACVNTPGGRSCGPCPAGYSADGATGCRDIDECASKHGGCDALRACINSAGSFHCADCPAGYANMGASACMDIDECASNANPPNGGCDPLRPCLNASGAPPSCGPCPAPRVAKGATACKCPSDMYEDGASGCAACPACSGSDGTGTDATSCRPASVVRALPAASTDFDATVTTQPDATLYAQQITLTAPAVIDMFGISKTSTYPATANVRLGLYSDVGDRPGSNMSLPKTNLVPLSGVSVTETAAQIARGSCLPAGKYWIASLSQGAIGLGRQNSVSTLTVSAAYANTDGDLPALWPSGATPSAGADDNQVTSQPRFSVWLVTLQL